MNVNTTQAAEILGISRDRVQTLIRKGSLQDLKERNPEKKKHYATLDGKAVRAFAKSDEWKELRRQLRFSAAAATTNGNGAHAPIEGGGLITMLRQIRDRLDAVDTKVDRLLKLWE